MGHPALHHGEEGSFGVQREPFHLHDDLQRVPALNLPQRLDVLPTTPGQPRPALHHFLLSLTTHHHNTTLSHLRQQGKHTHFQLGGHLRKVGVRPLYRYGGRLRRPVRPKFIRVLISGT